MYKIFFRKEIFSEDFKGLSHHEFEKILKPIKKKLSTEPLLFGKALQRELKGYFRLRVDFYRVIYKIDKNKILVSIIKIGKRKDNEVYEEAIRRLH